MENTDGNTSAPGGLESANSGSADNAVEFFGDALEFAEARIAKAVAQLKYGRRQEAEEALRILQDAQAGILAHRRATGEGQQSSEGMDG